MWKSNRLKFRGAYLFHNITRCFRKCYKCRCTMPKPPFKSCIKMRARFKCAFSFIHILLLCLEETHSHSKCLPETGYVQERKRAKRQAGYVYERPNVSFNLPSPNTVISTSTQASPVDRTVMQMYYAYPAPAEGNTVNVGYSSTVSTTPATVSSSYGSSNTGQVSSTSSSSVGYNYGTSNIAGENGKSGGSNQQITVQANLVNTGTGSTSGSSGYSYGAQNVAAGGGGSSLTIGQASTVTTGAQDSTVSVGYNYGGQNVAAGGSGGGSSSQTIGQISTVATGAGDSTDMGGYNYGAQYVAPGGSGGDVSTQTNSQISSINTETTSNAFGPAGYNYGVPNTGVSQTNIQRSSTSSTGGLVTSVTSSSAGYNYEVQNTVRGNTQILSTSSLSGSGYAAPTSTQSTPERTVSVSTNAPKYLPPSTNTQISISSNANPNSGLAPSDVYLPPSITSSVSPTSAITQPTSYVQPVVKAASSDVYIPPSITSNSPSFTKVTQTASNVQTAVNAAPSDMYLPQSIPSRTTPVLTVTQSRTYVQPVVNDVTQTSKVVSAPQNIYLKPNSLPTASNQNIQTPVSISSQPQRPSKDYLPPISASGNRDQFVSTPAATYLPPVL